MGRVRAGISSSHVPPTGNRWIAISREPLPLDEAMEWAVDPACGAVVSFSGTVRNQSEGRPGVNLLEYEAYEEFVVPKFGEIVDAVARQWPQVHKVAILHRVGKMSVTESSVFIVVSAEHRGSAFEAAKFCIDTLKVSAPVWKKEQWSGGSDWGSDPHEIVSIEEL
ncbi:MAG: molybdenum cofactor biosynthesis protein MoaE [Actinomycetota bacterium]|nr:molybdenum cofactor biosynthesis protein MoaE [Actinomycetota bacterium]